MTFKSGKHIQSKSKTRLAVAVFLATTLLFSGIQLQDSASAAVPTCPSPWFRDDDASNDFTGVLVCDYTVTSGTNVAFDLNLPEGVTEIYVVAVGGGGGGGGGGGTELDKKAGGGGGAGEVITDGLITGLTTSSSITYSVGLGGVGGDIPGEMANGGGNGGNTVVSIAGSAVVTARGGQGGAQGGSFTPGGGGQSGSGLSGGSGTGKAGGGGGGTLSNDYEWPELSGIWYRGAGANGTDGSGASSRKGGNGGEAEYFGSAPYTQVPFSGYYIGQETAETDIINFYKSTFGGAGGVVGGNASGEACTHDVDGVYDFYQYGTTGYSDGGLFMDSHGSCAYNDGGANGRATTSEGVGSGGGGGAGPEYAEGTSQAGLGSAGRDGALWLRFVQTYTVDDGSGDGDGSGGGNSSSSNAPTAKPNTPNAAEVSVSKGTGAINVAITYSGLRSNRPTNYLVTLSPGKNSCVAYGVTSSCDVLGLKKDVMYTVSIVAVNALGSSETYISTQKYFLTQNGLTSYLAKKNIDNFPGDSPKLLKSLKTKIKKFLTQHPDITTFTCTGYTAGPVKQSDKALAKTRASNVCAYIEKIKPSVSTTTIGKTPGLPWGPANRKVVIRGYSALG